MNLVQKKREKTVESDNPKRITGDRIRQAKEIYKVKQRIESPNLAQEISLQIQRLHTTNRKHSLRIIETLNYTETLLNNLKKLSKNDKDIYFLEQCLKDLRSDLDEGRSLELDSSMEHITENMKDLFNAAGVKVSKPQEFLKGDSKLSKKIQKLKELGIDIDYVVSNGKKNNKTVIYFPQTHADPKIKAPLSVTILSQDKIAKIISKCAKNGLGNHIFAEKYADNIKHRTPTLSPSYSFENKLEENSNLELFGFDPLTLKLEVLDSLMNDKKTKITMIKTMIDNGLLDEFVEKYGTDYFLSDSDVQVGKKDIEAIISIMTRELKKCLYYRARAHNVFAASSLASRLLSNDLSYVTFGAGHEYITNIDFPTLKNIHTMTGSDEKHPIPFSEAMAYYNINVIVIDTSGLYKSASRFPKDEISENLVVELTNTPKNN